MFRHCISENIGKVTSKNSDTQRFVELIVWLTNVFFFLWCLLHFTEGPWRSYVERPFPLMVISSQAPFPFMVILQVRFSGSFSWTWMMTAIIIWCLILIMNISTLYIYSSPNKQTWMKALKCVGLSSYLKSNLFST